MESLRGTDTKGVAKASVMFGVLLASRPKRSVVSTYSVKQDRVQFVISHNDLGAATFNQFSDLLKDLTISRAANVRSGVYQIAKEGKPASGRCGCDASAEPVRVRVDVGNDGEGGH